MKHIGSTVILLSLFLYPIFSFAQLTGQRPRSLQDIGVTQQLGEKVPLDLTFANARGDSVSLRQLFDDDKPVLLNPVYYECPQLCSLVKEAIFKGIQDLEWTPGREYTIITFSIDPDEGPELAAKNKKRFVSRLDRDVKDGWYFLTGNKENIRKLTEAVGFKFKKLHNGQFAHGAAIMFLSPEGKITRYLYGLKFSEFNLRNALYEAADGNIGTTAQQILLYCYQYDANANSYVPVAWKMMTLGGIITMSTLGLFLGLMWWRYRRTKNKTQINDSNGTA